MSLNMTIERMADKEINPKCRINFEEPSEELLAWAKENINEDPDTKDLVLSELRDMIFERGECTPSATDDDFLLRFLRARKFNIKVAHELYVNYHNFKEETPEYFKDINLEKMFEIVKKTIYNCPPNRDHLGRRILIFKLGEWVPSEHSPQELMQFVIFLIQIGLLEPMTQIKGAVLIIDLSGLSLEKVWYLTPTIARHIVSLCVSSFPVRLEAVYFLFSSWIFDTAFNMIKVFIPESVRDRISFLNDFDSLHDRMDPKYLPKSLGGALDDFSLYEWLKEIVFKDDKVLDELDKLGYTLKSFAEGKKKQLL